jgi:CubicO group peptidase (beta-lactamase class C family)
MFEPGTRWQYGTNIDWVGKIVETVSGERLDLYFRKHILGPLEMDPPLAVTTKSDFVFTQPRSIPASP